MSLYSRAELPEDTLPHYVRFNRSKSGDLQVGDAVPDVPLLLVAPTSTVEQSSFSSYSLLSHLAAQADAAGSGSHDLTLVVVGSFT